MKWILPGALVAISMGLAAQGSGAKTIYVLPMSGGLDLYVAQWLARGKVVRVTTNPRTADAILTDHLGEDFEHKLDQILAKDDKDLDDEGTGNSSSLQPYSAGRNRGTVFLVDAKTRQVLWSDYEKPPAYRSAEKLNQEAEKIAKRLSGDLK